MRLPAAVLAACFLILPAWASEPGEPIDCSDWIALEPGYTCSVYVGLNLADKSMLSRGANQAADNDGRTIRIRQSANIEIVAFDGTNDIVLGYFPRMRGISPNLDWLEPIQGCTNLGPTPNESCNYHYGQVSGVSFGGPVVANPFVFDAIDGRVLVGLHNWFGDSTDHQGYSGLCGHGSCYWIAAIEGFATTFEILQSYEPPSGPLSFRAPYMPEGFQFADFFDTYYGDLSTVGDWSQAQPLQCGYPATAPGVGDYLTVDDTLPDPAPGTGRYYVTAVHHQGQVRYGREHPVGGPLQGRDPAVLQTCN